mmetsp:Transcript_109953/g.342802  ORF Transcript_109953/g.342802 Transcript_109953/m.342802 type:complete len:719 (-) Transcript_109953:312-2468(-)
MTLGFDFDELEENDDASEPEADWPWPSRLAEEQLPGSPRTEELPDVLQRGFSGRPRGRCLGCKRCRGWAPSSSSTASRPRPAPGEEEEEEAGSQASARDDPWPPEARGSCLPSLFGAMPTFDGRRFTWPTPTDHFPRSEGSSWGENHPCARCGCAEREHEDVQAKFRRVLTEHDSIPLAALHWSHVEFALWADTDGAFWPGGRRTYCHDGQKPGVLVSVICPTTSSRSCFHPFLWHCFSLQEHTPRELVVIDTNEWEPSAFLEEKARSDSRLFYRHFRVPEKKWCIGLKRNLACYYAAGEVIAHFDDDDMYAPNYLSVMLKCLRDPREAFAMRSMNWSSGDNRYEVPEMLHALNFEDTGHGAQPIKLPKEAPFWQHSLMYGWGAACAKLCAWFSFTLQERIWCYCDQTDNDVPFTKDTRQGIYGWGFSLIYLRLAWQAIPFLHIDLGEDLDFVQSFRQLGLPMVLVPDRKGICAHTQHLENVSGTCVKGGSRGVTPSALLYSPLASVLSWYEITAQGFTKYQEDKKNGKAMAAAPVLLQHAERARAQRDASRAAAPKPPPAAEEWVPGMKWTKAAVVAMQEEIIEGFLEEPFLNQLHAAWKESSGKPQKQEVARRRMCMDVQAPVLTKYGFEPTVRGLFQSSRECSLPEEEVGIRDHFLQMLAHPGHKAWQFLWPFLPALRTDHSSGVLRTVLAMVEEKIQGLEQQGGAQTAEDTPKR